MLFRSIHEECSGYFRYHFHCFPFVCGARHRFVVLFLGRLSSVVNQCEFLGPRAQINLQREVESRSQAALEHKNDVRLPYDYHHAHIASESRASNQCKRNRQKNDVELVCGVKWPRLQPGCMATGACRRAHGQSGEMKLGIPAFPDFQSCKISN